MMNVANILRRVKRRVLDIEMFESSGALRIENIDKEALTERCQALEETICRLAHHATKLRAANTELRRKLAAGVPYTPTQLACDILLRYCNLDTTELSESTILEMYSEDEFDVKAALAELCEHNLLAVATKGPQADKLYAVTTAGQTQCFAFGH